LIASYPRAKDKLVLCLIVESYLKIGKPVSSGHVAQQGTIDVSPATVRNIMVRLEEEGYLAQPYTSAGRIPTDRGLKFYVNTLFEEALYPEQQVDFLSKSFLIQKGDFNSLLNDVSKLLSEYSGNLGFVISPRISNINFHHIRFIKISEEKIILILVTTFHLVLTEIIETKNLYTQVELDRASAHINENFAGRNLSYVRDYLLQEVPRYKSRYDDVIRKITSLLKSTVFQEESESRIFLQGVSKLVEKTEMFDIESLKSLFQQFEEKARLAKLLSDVISLRSVKVLIGSELDLTDISDCSLILSHYGYDRQVLGSLGIIGPKRIPYKKIIPLVDCVAMRLSQAMSRFQ
jgi:heat-inducible transcriptional repressor